MTYVYRFSEGTAVGDATMSALLGQKGAYLAELCRMGVKTPSGFTLLTEVTQKYAANHRALPEDVVAEIDDALKTLEQSSGRKLGGGTKPLILSVRTGTHAELRGALDSILNIGLNDETVKALAEETQDAESAYRAYRRFIIAYGAVVHHLDRDSLEDVAESATSDEEATRSLQVAFAKRAGASFPQNARDQVLGAISAAFDSWNSSKALRHRSALGLKADEGVACTVQQVAFGSFGQNSGAGVLFSRDAASGEKRIRGEFLPRAQGDELIQGIATPLPLTKEQPKFGVDSSLEESMPQVFAELVKIKDKLESHFRDMQEIEFVVQNGELFILQTRPGKRSARAALKIAVDLVHEGVSDERTALQRVEPAQIEKLLHPNIDPEAKRKIIAKGLPASPGGASGFVVFSAEDAIQQAKAGRRVVLVRIETSPEDIHGMGAAQGVLTSRGGMTSHAAVVARGMGRVCVVGCTDIRVDYNQKVFTSGETLVREGDVITIDGSSGEVMLGEVRTLMPELGEEFTTLLGWADKQRKLHIRANADTPKDIEVAVAFGAEGVGLCRTEHMFQGPEGIRAMQELILAREEPERKAVLKKLLPMQRNDFKHLFKLVKGLPLTVRLLDPPLHEFLPSSDEEVTELAKAMGMPTKLVRQKRDALREQNPMIGHRGSRLGITWPELYQMQVRALVEAVCELKKEGIECKPEVLLPLIIAEAELAKLKTLAVDTAQLVMDDMRVQIDLKIGCMIEVPRAAFVAKALAGLCDFFSFGTNDLTQTALGVSRDDSGMFLGAYVEQGILERDPFVTIDMEGVGELMRMATERGKLGNPALEVGICGEHGSDPASIAFCIQLGMNYVSCSPYRVAAARLAAARAALA
jgi:pyruvate, orthophosphate dikinase